MSAAAFHGAFHEDHCLLGKKLLWDQRSGALRRVRQPANNQQQFYVAARCVIRGWSGASWGGGERKIEPCCQLCCAVRQTGFPSTRLYLPLACALCFDSPLINKYWRGAFASCTVRFAVRTREKTGLIQTGWSLSQQLLIFGKKKDFCWHKANLLTLLTKWKPWLERKASVMSSWLSLRLRSFTYTNLSSDSGTWLKRQLEKYEIGRIVRIGKGANVFIFFTKQNNKKTKETNELTQFANANWADVRLKHSDRDRILRWWDLYRDTPIRWFPQNALIGRAIPIKKAMGFAAKERKSGRNWSKKASASAWSEELHYLKQGSTNRQKH